MNGHERIMAAISGRQPDSTPVMLHNFMMAAREAGLTMARYRRDPKAIARAFIESVERYGYDGIMVDVDTATLAGAVGVPVEFPEDEPAIARGSALASLADVERLEPPDVARYPGVQVWLEAVRLLRGHFGNEVTIRGNCDQAPFALASQMRGASEWMMDLMDPANCESAVRLLDYCAEAGIQFLRLMAAAGAHMLSNGDSAAGASLISPRMHRAFAHSWERRMAASSRRLGLPHVLHVCGNTNAILTELAATGSDALELDFKTDAVRAREVFEGRVAFIGNIDPTGVLLQAQPAEIERKTRELIQVFAGNPRFILNAGCAIPATTPPENLRAMIRASRELSGKN